DAIASRRAFGLAAAIRSRNSITSARGGSKSTISSCGLLWTTFASASGNDSTARTRWRGANFFRAETIAAVSASYSSTRRTLGAVPAGDSWEAGTAVASEKAENRRSARHVKAKQRKLRAPKAASSDGALGPPYSKRNASIGSSDAARYAG